MPLLFVRQDVTCMQTDAIVCPTDASFSASGGTDAAIRRKAGIRMRAACRALGKLQGGEVRRTDGFRLPCRYVFHVHGPVWQGGDRGETDALAACYARVLEQAYVSGCESIAFPVLSAGRFGFPNDVALQTAVCAIRNDPRFEEMTVYLALYNDDCALLAERYGFLRRMFFSDTPPLAPFATLSAQRSAPRGRKGLYKPAVSQEPAAVDDACRPQSFCGNLPDAVPCEASDEAPEETPSAAFAGSVSLETLLAQRDESFSEMLLRLIDEKGLTDAQCYKKANVDRKLFSKIRSNAQYKPSKSTALAFAVALELSLPQTQELLQKAGFAFSHSSKFDLIVEYFIRNGQYDIYTINEALFSYDQSLLS